YFYRRRRERSELDAATLEIIVREICKSNRGNSEIMFYWHGGEPLLAGIEFYQKAIQYQNSFKERGQRIRNGITTNGTLIDKAWANFFMEYGFQIGVSLDGPEQYHDQYRLYPDGKGSFQDVIRGINILKETGVKFHVISVITNESAVAPRQVLEFFALSDLSDFVNFVPSLGIETGEVISFENSVSPRLYVDFLIEVFDLWLKECKPSLRVLPLESVVRAFMGRAQEDCRFAGECERNLVLDCDGSVLACSTHGYMDSFKFGNIRHGFASILRSSTYQKYKGYLLGIKERCSGCRWYQICNGGCPREHWLGGYFNNMYRKDCKDLKHLYKYIEERLKAFGLV
ncbi:SPASM domain-containing protein, partial [Dehalococcoidia bacterium]|nr:SPASM domain-containing protein [Dehalococcoidia bacterium]